METFTKRDLTSLTSKEILGPFQLWTGTPGTIFKWDEFICGFSELEEAEEAAESLYNLKAGEWVRSTDMDIPYFSREIKCKQKAVAIRPRSDDWLHVIDNYWFKEKMIKIGPFKLDISGRRGRVIDCCIKKCDLSFCVVWSVEFNVCGETMIYEIVKGLGNWCGPCRWFPAK